MGMVERRAIFADWPGPWGAWAQSYCRKNAWRVASTLGDETDAFAECAYQFVLCKQRYGAVCEKPAHFMRMFQLMVITRFHDLSVKDSKHRHMVQNFQYTGSTVHLGAFMNRRLKGASKELSQVLHIIFTAPGEVLEPIAADCKTPKKYFAAIAQRLGITQAKQTEIVKELRLLLH